MSTSLLSLKNLFQQTWVLYKKSLKTFFLLVISVIPFLVILGGLVYLALLFIPWASEYVNKVLSILLGVIFLVILGFGILLTENMLFASFITAIKNFDIGKKQKFKDLIKSGFKRVLSFTWVHILFTFIGLIGMLLFLIPGIIFTVWFMFAYYIVVYQNIKGFRALRRSKELVKGHFWGVFGRGLLYVLVLYLILLLPALIGGISGLSENYPKVIENIETGWYIIIQLLFPPLGINYFYVIYKDLLKGKSLA